MYQILLVEDDESIREVIADYMDEKGKDTMRLTLAEDGRACEGALERQTFDLILLDVMLPDIDGFTLCRNDTEKRYGSNRIPDCERKRGGYTLGLRTWLRRLYRETIFVGDTVCEDTCHPAADKAGEPERDDYLWRNPDGQAELSGICEGTGSTVAEQAV